MDLTTGLFQEVQGRRICRTRTIGINDHAAAGGNDDTNTWVLSPTVTISSSGVLMQPESAPVLWLERPTSSSNSTNLLLNESLACSTVTLWIMEKHCWSWLRQHNGCLHHGSILQTICGCSGIPILYGIPGSCKSEALKCGLSLFGTHNTHFYNSQTTPSFCLLRSSRQLCQLDWMTSMRRHKIHERN